MKISEIFDQKKTVFSFEVFPPKKTSYIDSIYSKLGALSECKPDFISVTYGAGGGGASVLTADICKAIQEQYNIPAMMHLTCVNSSKESVEEVLKLIEEYKIENILALRGDIVPDLPRQTDFMHANELVTYIKARGDFHVSGACYPEGHPESDNMVEDILNLIKKVEAGAEHLVSQLFFDNNMFYEFQEKARLAGINVPIEAGIMPVVNKAQIERMVTTCGASLPAKFVKMMNRFEHSPEALRDAGIAYAIDQVVDLMSQGVDGVHLYTMNQPEVAKKISDAVVALRNA
ncbi:MAG: methylenetetrahydrofolate reductase [Lachnospiraceae bacterium]|nr:methylenetetrahydrofolate reductase [NAD(P)H] [Lachnospiraceae bacterium]